MTPNNHRKPLLSLVVIAFLLITPLAIQAQNDVTPGKVYSPYPTITNLAFEWLIKGDDNANAVCAVKFRRQGEAAWHDGMPLRRVVAGKSQDTDPIYSWENKFSGSIFNLRPNTNYEVNLSLADPDGTKKDTLLTIATRPVPRIAAGYEIHEVPDGNNGTLSVTKDGTAEKPLVYRSLTRKAVYTAVTINNRKWVYLEGLTINGALKMRGAKNCAVMRCSVNVTESAEDAIDGQLGITNCSIADNKVIGPVLFTGPEMGAAGATMVEGIQITGSGNVIRNNYVKGFHDCLSHMEDDEVDSTGQICNDWLYNDVFSGLDDGIEADFAFNNCRIMGNRFTDCFNAMSSQPSLGGPTYFIRNVVFNATMGAFKLNRFSIGDVVLHNSIIKAGDGLCTFDENPFDFSLWMNNLALGGVNGGWDGSQVTDGYSPGPGYACRISACGTHCSFDYDAVGTYKTTFQARINGKDFFAIEPHGRKIDSSAFAQFKFPSPPAPEPQYYYQPQDMRPAPACTSVVDKAGLIPNVNDEFLGAGPDIGAYEAGQALPVYGPRPEGVDEQTPFDGNGALPQPRMKAQRKIEMRVTRNQTGKKISIAFAGTTPGNTIDLSVYDVRGELVKKLVSNGELTSETIFWDGKTDRGNRILAGIYYIRLATPHGTCAQRITIIK
jgi:hypothetical protein